MTTMRSSAESMKMDEFQGASESSHKLALSRMEYLNDDGQDDGMAKHVVELLESTVNSWQKKKAAARLSIQDDGDGEEESPSSENASSSFEARQVIQMLTILQNINLVDSTLTEEIARSAGFLPRLRGLLNSPENTIATTTTTTTTTTTSGKDEKEFLEHQVQRLVFDVMTSFTQSNSEDDDNGDDALPFSRSELQSRLPLIFALPQYQEQTLKILIQQSNDKETAQHDVGFVMWPSSVTLARWITMNPSIIIDSAAQSGILELGAGCGLVGLTAATLLQHNDDRTAAQCTKQEQQGKENNADSANTIFLTDYNPTVLENLARNIRLNDLDEVQTTVVGLDFWDQPDSSENNNENDDITGTRKANAAQAWVDMDGTRRPQVSLVLAADILCYSNDAELVANTIQAALVEGGQAILVSADANLRFGVEHFPQACRNAGLEIEITTIVADQPETARSNDGERTSGAASSTTGSSSRDGVGCMNELLVHDLEQTTGFTKDYSTLMFKVTKPITNKN